jgi:exonuclease III
MLIKFFSYNIHGLPFLPDKWTQPLYEWFNGCDYDFICIQEAFTPGRIDGIVTSLTENGYTVLRPNDIRDGVFLGSGLITAVRADRWRIQSSGFTAYAQCTGAETLANKGFHWLRVSALQDHTEFVVINTHMQADHLFNYFIGCIDARPIRQQQMHQIVSFLNAVEPCRSLIVGDINSEIEPHDDLVYLTGERQGIRKHTFEPTGEDLDHVAFIPRLWQNYVLPIVRNSAVLTRLWWSDHWPIHVELELVV